MRYLEKERQYDKKGREILKVIHKGNYSIRLVKNENAKEDKSSFYKLLAELLYEEAMR